MTIKYRRSIALAGIAAITAIITAPPSAVAAEPTTGTIHVVSIIQNDNMGNKMASDFIFTLRRTGSDVKGSPFVGAVGAGVTFVLAPGSYVVSTPVVDGYSGTWSGVGVVNGHIVLEADQEVTITRTFTDSGMASGAVTPPATTTENGGALPATSSPWFNTLAIGLLLFAVGALGIRKSVFSSK